MLRRALDAAQAAAALLVLRRLARGRVRHPPLREGAPAPEGAVSIVIPARDEEGRLGPCLDGLRADPALITADVIVVDDRSTDGTAALARAGGARVVAGAEPPPGWAGKAWALHQGLEAATGTHVVFLDADTRPEPGLVAALIAASEPFDVLSATPRYEHPSPAGRALHASMTTTIAYRVGPLDTPGWQPPPERALLNGQCVVVRRVPFLTDGGWERVSGSLVEDVALAQALRREGRTIGVADATALLSVRPYESARETWSGWGRSLLWADLSTPARNALDLITLWLTLVLPPLRLLARRPAPLDVVLVLLRLGMLGALRDTYRPRGPAFWLSPLADPATCVRLTLSAVRPDRAWRGRRYG